MHLYWRKRISGITVAISWNNTAMKFARWLTAPFMNNFSVARSAVWKCFSCSRMSFKTGVSALKPTAPASSVSWGNTLNSLLLCQPCSQHLLKSRLHLKKPLTLFIHKSNSSSIQILSWDCSHLGAFSGSTSNSSFPAVPHLPLLPPLKSRTPQSYPWGLDSTSPNLLLTLVLWPLPMNHECF